jgi:hypothetical protein
MAREDPQINIRLPNNLKDRIQEAATMSNRSMNSEIVERLERSFSGEKLRPQMVISLEALPYGAKPQQVSLATFLNSFRMAIKGSIEQLDETRGVNEVPEVRQSDTLRPSDETEILPAPAPRRRAIDVDGGKGG